MQQLIIAFASLFLGSGTKGQVVPKRRRLWRIKTRMTDEDDKLDKTTCNDPVVKGCHYYKQ